MGENEQFGACHFHRMALIEQYTTARIVHCVTQLDAWLPAYGVALPYVREIDGFPLRQHLYSKGVGIVTIEPALVSTPRLPPSMKGALCVSAGVDVFVDSSFTPAKLDGKSRQQHQNPRTLSLIHISEPTRPY